MYEFTICLRETATCLQTCQYDSKQYPFQTVQSEKIQHNLTTEGRTAAMLYLIEVDRFCEKNGSSWHGYLRLKPY